MGFGDEPEQCPVAVEAPGLSLGGHVQRGLAVAVKQLVAEAARGVLVGDLDGDGADPLDVDHGDKAVREDAGNGAVGRDFLERSHVSADPTSS